MKIVTGTAWLRARHSSRLQELMCLFSIRTVIYRWVSQYLNNLAIFPLKIQRNKVSLRAWSRGQWFSLGDDEGVTDKSRWKPPLYILRHQIPVLWGTKFTWSKSCIPFSNWVIKAVELWGKLCKFWPEDVSLLIPWHMIRLVRTQHAFATAWSHVWMFNAWAHLGKAWQLASEEEAPCQIDLTGIITLQSSYDLIHWRVKEFVLKQGRETCI